MKVELFPPDSDTEPRHWVRHDQAFAMMLGPGSIEWGSKRSALEKFAYAAGDLALCDRHQGEWVGLMNVPHLQLGISDEALMDWPALGPAYRQSREGHGRLHVREVVWCPADHVQTKPRILELLIS